MATYTRNGYYYNLLNIGTSGNSLLLGKDAVVFVHNDNSNAVGVLEAEGVLKNKITINGAVTADFYGLQLGGTKTQITIGADGSIAAQYAANIAGTDQTLTNNGKLVGGVSGVFGDGEGLSVINNRLITGLEYGINVYENVHVTNSKSGTIYSPGIGLYINPGETSATMTVNHGTIRGDGTYAFQGGGGNDTLISDGKLVGTIYMGAGNDLADLRGTKSHELVYGSLGDDTLITDRSDVSLFEFSGPGGGYDTVKSSASFTLRYAVEALTLFGKANVNGSGNADANHLIGNDGNNTLKGLAGMDRLAGGAGNDKLVGGADADKFVFGTGDDHDVITDFETGVDKILLSRWKAISDFGDVVSHAHNSGDDVIIKSGDDWLTISHMAKADLNQGDFSF